MLAIAIRVKRNTDTNATSQSGIRRSTTMPGSDNCLMKRGQCVVSAALEILLWLTRQAACATGCAIESGMQGTGEQ